MRIACICCLVIGLILGPFHLIQTETRAQSSSKVFSSGERSNDFKGMAKTDPSIHVAGDIRDTPPKSGSHYWDGRYWGDVYRFVYGYGLGYQYGHPKSWGQPRGMYGDGRRGPR